MSLRLRLASLSLLVFAAGCGQEFALDSGPAPEEDAGPTGPTTDAGPTADAGLDAGFDAGPKDAGFDAGPQDAGPPPVCTEQDAEPNDARLEPVNLGTLTDDDDDGSEVMGTLAGVDDVDWFSYNGTDELFLIVDPEASLDAQVAIRLCMFVTCDEGATLLSCPGGTEAIIGGEGLEACCWNRVDAAILSMDVDCDGFDEDARVELRVDQAPDNDACVNYSLSYHY